MLNYYISMGSNRDLGWFGEFPHMENSILVLAGNCFFFSIMQITYQNCACLLIFYSLKLKNMPFRNC